MRERTPLLLLVLVAAAPAQAPLPAQARLEGEVLTATLEPVANALVELEHDGLVVAKTRSDGQGVFVFPKAPQRFVVARALADGPDIGAAVVDLLGETRGFVTVVLRPARAVHGTVRDESGKAVPGAVVLASPRGYWPGAFATCSTHADAQGAYRLTHVPMGPAHVRAWAPDAAAFAGTVDGTNDVALDCVVDRSDANECVFALDRVPADGGNVELHVRAGNDSDPVPLPAELARPQQVEPGRWLVRGWLEGDELRVHLAGTALTAYPAEASVLAGIGSTTRRFATADEDGRLRGRVVDADGKGVAELPLLVQPAEGRPGDALRRLATTGADGTFVVQAPVGTGENFAIRSLSTATVIVGNDVSPAWFVGRHEAGKQWELRVAPACSVVLRFVDGGGAPAPGIDVVLRAIGNRARILGTAVSGLDGVARIDSLWLAGVDTVHVEASGRRGVATIDAKVAAGGVTDLGTATLSAPASFLVTATAPNGTPLSGCRVHCQQLGEEPLRFYSTATDRQGRIRWSGVTTGLYYVGPWGAGVGQQRSVATGDEVEVTVIVNDR